jgi:hypothetical protein
MTFEAMRLDEATRVVVIAGSTEMILRRNGEGLRKAQSRTRALLDMALGAMFQGVVTRKIRSGRLDASHLDNERVLAAAERYLSKKYNWDLKKDPAETLLYGNYSSETGRVVRELVDIADLQATTIEDLEDPEVLACIEEELSATFDVDLVNTDPAHDILEGTWKEETESVISQLVS